MLLFAVHNSSVSKSTRSPMSLFIGEETKFPFNGLAPVHSFNQCLLGISYGPDTVQALG